MALGGVCAFAGDPVGPLPRAIATSALTTRNVRKTSIATFDCSRRFKPVKLIGCHPRASRIPPAHWRSGRDERARGR
jgi:hypothetical protein